KQLHYKKLRKFVVEYLGDAVAYQPVEELKQNYDKVHQRVGKSLRRLSETAGGHAPLCVISHSVGAVIVSKYFYDLQMKLAQIAYVDVTLPLLARDDALSLSNTMRTTLLSW